MVAQILREVKGLDKLPGVCYTPRVPPSQHVHIFQERSPVGPIYVYGHCVLLRLYVICWEAGMSFELGVSIATRERCGVCHKVSPVGFAVPETTWKIAVPDYFRESILCVPCFTSFADERMIPWDREIRFYPVSLRTHLEDTRDLWLTRGEDLAKPTKEESL